MMSSIDKKNIQLILAAGPALHAFSTFDPESLRDITLPPEVKEQLRNIDDMLEILTLAKAIDPRLVPEEVWEELEGEEEGVREIISALFQAIPKLEETLIILKSKM